MEERTCRVCGCTDDAACLTLGVPCCWILEDLCSGCATVRQLLASEDAGLPWLIAVMTQHAGLVLINDLVGAGASVEFSHGLKFP